MSIGSNATGIIYLYTSPSGKQYVGQTWDEQKRMNNHKYCGGGPSAFHSAIKKYGYENFKYEILHKDVEAQAELDALEIAEIFAHNSISPNGYNLALGGAHGRASEETKQKQSKSAKKRGYSADKIEKMTQAWKGKHHSEESRNKIRIANTGRNGWKHSSEAREKISAAGKGRRHTEESIQKMRESKLGIPRSPETIAKMVRANRERDNSTRRKCVRCVELNVIFDCVKTAAIVFNVTVFAIRNAINGSSKSSAGYHWEYMDWRNKYGN